MTSQIQKYLLPLLNSAIRGTISNFEISQLVKIAHQFAVVRLNQLLHSKKIVFDLQAHSLSTIALDCIAELFKRDEDGIFLELTNYFSDEHDLKILSDEEALIMFRRLIFSKLNDGVFRLYNEYDPFTSKILRNIKIAQKQSKNILLIERMGEPYLTISTELNSHQPEMPMDILETELISSKCKKENTKHMLVCALEILAAQEEYRRYYSMVDLALIIKGIFLKIGYVPSTNMDLDGSMIHQDIKSIIEKSFTSIQAEIKKKYLDKNKIDEKTFNLYMHAVYEMLTNIFLLNEGVELSYFDYFHKYDDKMSLEIYRRKHRIIFEYIAKLAKNLVIENLKDAFE